MVDLERFAFHGKNRLLETAAKGVFLRISKKEKKLPSPILTKISNPKEFFEKVEKWIFKKMGNLVKFHN